jgi:hypothetical protein
MLARRLLKSNNPQITVFRVAQQNAAHLQTATPKCCKSFNREHSQIDNHILAKKHTTPIKGRLPALKAHSRKVRASTTPT